MGRLVLRNVDWKISWKNLYDVDVFYMNQQVKNYHFSAWFKRSSSINEVINILEKTKKISLDLKGRILTVKDISRN